MNRRNAVTLTEVLIAIFVLSIGLMALLSLFPLGAAQMAQAIKDQRAAEAATTAAGMARVIWKRVCDDDANSFHPLEFVKQIRPAIHEFRRERAIIGRRAVNRSRDVAIHQAQAVTAVRGRRLVGKTVIV